MATKLTFIRGAFRNISFAAAGACQWAERLRRGPAARRYISLSAAGRPPMHNAVSQPTCLRLRLAASSNSYSDARPCLRPMINLEKNALSSGGSSAFSRRRTTLSAWSASASIRLPAPSPITHGGSDLGDLRPFADNRLEPAEALRFRSYGGPMEAWPQAADSTPAHRPPVSLVFSLMVCSPSVSYFAFQVPLLEESRRAHAGVSQRAGVICGVIFSVVGPQQKTKTQRHRSTSIDNWTIAKNTLITPKGLVSKRFERLIHVFRFLFIHFLRPNRLKTQDIFWVTSKYIVALVILNGELLTFAIFVVVF
ncbi:unnamed protein product [Caenorhabditis auriculariae]|uniref:Uncharacterized protein n=1 Tax=Caenorhabditis auriculariae TaxID=2777116 RepID=A0A8S1HJU8_9PELO|nr:unnamed protein product [Caenorhabditis auriculariae]